MPYLETAAWWKGFDMSGVGRASSPSLEPFVLAGTTKAESFARAARVITSAPIASAPAPNAHVLLAGVPRMAKRSARGQVEPKSLPADWTWSTILDAKGLTSIGSDAETEVADDAPEATKLYVKYWDAYRAVQDAAQRVIEPPPAYSPGVELLAKWEGVVLEVGDDSFLARLTDEIGDQPEVEAEIFASEVPVADRDLLKARAVFYWTIAYRDTKVGDRVRESRLRFRRLPGWRDGEIDEARSWATEVRRELGWT